MFSQKQIAYLRSHRLARIATVSPDGKPDVVPQALLSMANIFSLADRFKADSEVQERQGDETSGCNR